MRKRILFGWLFVAAVVIVGGVLIMNLNHTTSLSVEILMQHVPTNIDGWRATGRDRYYDADTIFDYIDGGGEVYRAYNLRRCAARRYEHSSGPEIVLDVFDLGSASDAFGVFTHDLDGDPVSIGQDGRYRPGWLSFWKNRFFVSIYAMEETDASARIVRELGRTVAAAIADEGRRPELLAALPDEGQQTNRIRYLHHHLILNYHYYLADKNILDIDDTTPTVLATYRRSAGQAQLLLVRYPSTERCRAAARQWVEHYVPESVAVTPVQLENGSWTAWRIADPLLAIVLEAETAAAAETLLADVPAK
ncbi:MAG: hypothetical protein JXQ27_09020 [Acidobacteria bacterium]|nr:hypothetical protein [Acidobacteriota bacterium]